MIHSSLRHEISKLAKLDYVPNADCVLNVSHFVPLVCKCRAQDMFKYLGAVWILICVCKREPNMNAVVGE